MIADTLLSSWRLLTRDIELSGPALALVRSCAPRELTEDHLLLACATPALAAPEVVSALSGSISAALGREFRVTLDATGPREGETTFGELSERERREYQRALVEAFQVDPFVRKCVEILGGAVDELSVRPLTPPEIKESVSHERRHPGPAGAGPEAAEER